MPVQWKAWPAALINAASQLRDFDRQGAIFINTFIQATLPCCLINPFYTLNGFQMYGQRGSSAWSLNTPDLAWTSTLGRRTADFDESRAKGMHARVQSTLGRRFLQEGDEAERSHRVELDVRHWAELFKMRAESRFRRDFRHTADEEAARLGALWLFTIIWSALRPDLPGFLITTRVRSPSGPSVPGARAMASP